jgi:uncharacterized heparinase superfamily protein
MTGGVADAGTKPRRSAGRAFADLRNRIGPAGPRDAAYWVARLWFRGLFYGHSLRGRRPSALTFIPAENWPGSAERGALLASGQLRFRNHTVSAQDAASGVAKPGEVWLAEYHSFGWLRDLRAVGSEDARIRARAYIADWIVHNARWHPLSWRPDILAARISNWLTHAEFVSAGGDAAFAEALLESIARQVKHLRRAARFVPGGVERLVVLRGLVYAGLCLPGGIRYLPRLLRQVASACDRQILQDGGHVERSPLAQLEALRNLIDIRAGLQACKVEVPEALQRAIDRAAPMLRFFRHGDGGLALFNGADEGEPWLIDVVLTRAEARGKPLASATHTGFERVSADRTLLIVDSGPPSRVARGAHAGTLSFEMSVGKQRIIVNCGAFSGRDEAWRQVQRSTAAHSTLTVDDRNSTGLRDDGSVAEGPRRVTAERMEADGNVWLDLSHDAYLANAGVTHRRRIYVNGSGTDIRGEDSLAGTGDHKFAIRFHLHPTIKASLVKDGTSVLLRAPDGSGWRMRCSGGVASLQESIYLGDSREARRCEQIVITGATASGHSLVKWALTQLAKR